MPKVKFGVIYSRLHPQVSIPAFAKTVEGLGFDSLWTTEGLANEMPALDILMALAAFAAHTKRITIGSCVILLPLRNPAILAKSVATLDYLSKGRLIFGVGVGGSENSNIASFQVCGVNPKERGARTDEALEIMSKLWTGRPVSHHGRFYQFQDIKMEPTPLQKPHVPLWAGGAAKGVLRRAARWCQGFVPTGVPPWEYPKLWEKIEGYCDQFGTDVSKITKAVHIYYCTAGSKDEGRNIAHTLLSRRYGYDANVPGDGRHAFGTPDDVKKVIQSYIDIGVTHFVFNTARPLPEVLPDIERLGTEILPSFR